MPSLRPALGISIFCLALSNFVLSVAHRPNIDRPNINRPNIVLIVADDIGWNDVGYRNPDMITPNLDRLAREGMILNQSYVLPTCSPTRSALLTGRYPFKLGTQHSVIVERQPVCVPLKYPMVSNELKKLGYATHIVGKWHQGFCNWNCTPTYRGFDSFFGIYASSGHHFSHTEEGYLDFRDDVYPTRNYSGIYSTFAYTQRAVDIISDHNSEKPLFLYLPYQAPHDPIEVPEEYEQMYPDIQNEGRRKYSGMVTALDAGVGQVVEALRAKGLLNNTLIVFTSDNGPELPSYGSCTPLRGGKRTLFEGGTRAIGFVHGYGINNPGTVYNYMIHAVDWLPTLVVAAGGRAPRGLDGVSQWKALSSGQRSARDEFVYNLDNNVSFSHGLAAIRVGKYKLIDGYPGRFDGWYQPMNDTEDTRIMLTDPSNSPVYLFDLEADPEERIDLSRRNTNIVRRLRGRLNYYRLQFVEPMFPEFHPLADPVLYGGVWSPGWC